MKKKKVLFHSDYCGVSTGFGGFIRELLEYLYKTGKYELFLYAGGVNWFNPDFVRWPWKVFGAIPNNQEELNSWLSQFPEQERPFRHREMQYGSMNIDKVIHEVKPDIYIHNQDFWGANYVFDRKWWNKINCVYNWTLDSRPILEDAQNNAHKIKYHYVWADFGVKEFKEIAKNLENKLINKRTELLSQNFNNEEQKKIAFQNFEILEKQTKQKIEAYNQVKLLRGTINTKDYKRLSDIERLQLRQKHKIDPNDFCIGMLSRNQLRKFFGSCLEGFKLFQQQNPNVKNVKILFFTHYSEMGGWDIPKFIRELNIENSDVLACYKCRKTGEFFTLPYLGQDIDNPITGDKKSLITVNLNDPLTCEQVNQWYNLLNAFCLPISSGGQERAVQEAKLCELITIINPYSCFEDSCVPEAYSLSLEQSFYRECGTNFIKSSPYPKSIAEQFKKVYDMPEKERKEWGKKARQWVLDNFSVNIIGKQYEELIDSMPEHNWDFTYPLDIKNPNSEIDFSIEDDYEFINQCYKKILNMHDMVKEKPEISHWLNFLNQ